MSWFIFAEIFTSANFTVVYCTVAKAPSYFVRRDWKIIQFWSIARLRATIICILLRNSPSLPWIKFPEAWLRIDIILNVKPLFLVFLSLVTPIRKQSSRALRKKYLKLRDTHDWKVLRIKAEEPFCNEILRLFFDTVSSWLHAPVQRNVGRKCYLKETTSNIIIFTFTFARLFIPSNKLDTSQSSCPTNELSDISFFSEYTSATFFFQNRAYKVLREIRDSYFLPRRESCVGRTLLHSMASCLVAEKTRVALSKLIVSPSPPRTTAEPSHRLNRE